MRLTLNKWKGRLCSCNSVPAMCKLPETWIQPLCVMARCVSHGCISRVFALTVPLLPFRVSRHELPGGAMGWAWTPHLNRTKAASKNLAADSPSAPSLSLCPLLPSVCPHECSSPHTCFILLFLQQVSLLLTSHPFRILKLATFCLYTRVSEIFADSDAIHLWSKDMIT